MPDRNHAGAADLRPTDLESWARDYRLEVTATDVGLVVTGINGHICQHTDDLLAVTLKGRWVSSRHNLICDTDESRKSPRFRLSYGTIWGRAQSQHGAS
jgi:hypothetical protein